MFTDIYSQYMRNLIVGFALLIVSGGGQDTGAPPAADSSSSAASPPADSSSAPATGSTGAAGDTSGSSAGTTSPAGAVENSVPAYPPLGEKSAAMEKWTPDGILRTVQDNGEGTLKDRFQLQQALMDSVDEKNASMAGMMKIIADSRAKMMRFGKSAQNVSTLLFADATAGGLVASTMNVHNEIPATQKLLSSTMTKQLTSLQTDATGIKNSVAVAESEYKERMKALADTVSSMIAKQDALFARLAAQQARAMARSSQQLQSLSMRNITSLSGSISNTRAAEAGVASGVSSGIVTARVALGDVQDSLSEIQSQFKDAVDSTVGDVQSTVNQQADKSSSSLDKAADSASLAAQASAMNAGRLLTRQLDTLDRNATQMIGVVVDNTTRVTSSLAKSTDKTFAKTESDLDHASSALGKDADGVDTESQLLSSDQLQVAQDMEAALRKQEAISSAAGAGFSTDMSKVNGLISAQMSGLTSQAKGVSQDVVSGTSDESIRLQQALSYLQSQASAGSLGVGAGTSDQLAAQQKAQAELLAQRQAQIGGAGDQLNAQMTDASKAALRGSGALSDRVSGMTSTFGGSIDGLLSSLTDGSGSGADGLGQLATALEGRASDAFSSIIQQLKGVSNGGVDAEENFVSTIVGPSRDNAASGMSQIQQLISALSSQLGDQSNGQQATLDLLRSFQSGNGQRMTNVTQALNAIRALNGHLDDTVSSGGNQALTDARSRLIANMIAEMNSAKNSSSDGLSRIDQIIGSLVGGSISDNTDRIGQTFAVAGANLDSSNQQFVQVERDQIKSLSGLSSMAASLLGDSTNAGLQQKGETEASLANARANIVAKFKEIAAKTTGTDIGNVMQILAKQGNDTAIVQFLLGDVQTALKRINADAVTARDSSDKKRAEFEAYLAKAQASLQQAQADIMSQLSTSVDQVQSQLNAKINLIQSSRGEMNQSLSQITSQVEQATQTLNKNLLIYQDKLEKIIDEIRSYMNMSANADELAIRQDIANQLGKVNATEAAIAGANAAVQIGIDQRVQANSQTGSSSMDVVDGVINAALETQGSVYDAHIGQSDKLVAVAANVDASATELDQSVKSAATLMQTGISTSSDTATRAITSAEGDQSKIVGQLNDRSSEVAKQSRKNFVNSLEKMGGLDDDTLRVSKQLQTLIGNADSSITDISESTMSHLDLSTGTMAKLNQAAVKKVASVSDVMGAFSAVVLGFLNETRSQMDTIMNELNSVDAASKAKLKDINTRSKDELNWVGSGLNATVDDLSQILDHEQIMQQGLMNQLLLDEGNFKSSEATKSSESSDIQVQVSQLRQKVNKHKTDEVSRVREWVSSRNPQVAQALFGQATAESFVESISRDAIIHDIRARIREVKNELQSLELAK